MGPNVMTPRTKPLLLALNHLVVRATSGVQVDEMPIPAIAKKRIAVTKCLTVLIKRTPRARTAQKTLIILLSPIRSVKLPTMGANLDCRPFGYESDL
jgi:hypothetical protein